MTSGTAPPPSLETFLGADPDAFVASRRRSAEAFLATRGLGLADVARIAAGGAPGSPVVLLTSSPVHGLANRLSDIDTICVAAEDDDGVAGMATQLFSGDNHLETIVFTTAAVDEDLRELGRLATAPPAQAAAGHGAWNRRRRIRVKYLERIVNGLATDGSMPYAEHLPALGAVWRAASLGRALRCGALAVIAERAGERRGRVAYAANAALFAMDAVLSHRGDVFSNRKWYLLRWERLLASGAAGDEVDAVETLRAALYGPIGTQPELAGPLAAALGTVAGRLGAPGVRVAVRHAEGVRRAPLLPGAEMLLAPAGGAVPTTASGEAVAPTALRDLAALEPERAAVVLRAARAGAVEVDPWA